MMKNRLAAFLLTLVMLICATSPISYADNTVQPLRFSDFSSVYAGIYDEGLGIYTMEGGATANSGSKKVVVTLTLEKIVGDKWEAVPGYGDNFEAVSVKNLSSNEKQIVSDLIRVVQSKQITSEEEKLEILVKIAHMMGLFFKD